MSNKIHIKDLDLVIFEGSKIYNSICNQSRVLPNIPRLETIISDLYRKTLETNLNRLVTYSPKFFNENIRNEINFINYQSFLYLMVFIKHCYENRYNHDLNLYPKVVTGWCVARYNSDTDYFINGPTTLTNYSVEFKKIYQSYISASTNMETISDYLQLMAIENISKHTNNTNETIRERPNSFDKLTNEAQSFRTIVEATALEEDSELYFEFKFNGDSNITNLEATLDEEVKQETKITPKTDITRFSTLMKEYSSITIDSLIVNSKCFKTPLDIFEKVYVVFSDFIGETLTENDLRTSFGIPGKFIKNKHNYEFVPDYPIAYKPSTIAVKKLRFKIVVPNEKLFYNKPTYSLDKVFNTFIGTNTEPCVKFILAEKFKTKDGEYEPELFKTNTVKRNNINNLAIYYKPQNIMYYAGRYFKIMTHTRNQILNGSWKLTNLLNDEANVELTNLIDVSITTIITEAFKNQYNTYVNYIENRPIGLIFESTDMIDSLNDYSVLNIKDNLRKISVKKIESIPAVYRNNSTNIHLAFSLK